MTTIKAGGSLVLTLASVLLLSGLWCMLLSPTTNVTVVRVSWHSGYGSLQELTNASDAIVEGVVIDAESYKEELDEHGCDLIFTDYSFKVQLVIKGSLKRSDVITIHQTGGTVGEQTLIVCDDPLFRIGETLILFLHEYDGIYFTLCGPQGRFIVQNGLVYSSGETYKSAEGLTRALKTNGQSEEQFVDTIKSALKVAR